MVNLRNNGNEWKVADRGKKRKKPALLGTNIDGGLKGVLIPSRDYWQFSVTRLEEQTTDDAVRRHLHSAGIEVKDIWMLGSKLKGTRTAKIRVAKEHKERAKDPSLWPVHCQIRDWEFGPKKTKTVQ